MDELEEGKVKELAAVNVANAWANLDLESAQRWVKELSASESRDRAAEEILKSAWFHYPEESLTLAQSVTDDERRNRLLQEVITNLARQNPDLAAQQVENAELSSDWSDIVEQERAIRTAFEN